MAEILHLTLQLHGKCLAEGEIGLNDVVAPQRALYMNVGFTELLGRDGNMVLLVGTEQQLAPVDAGAVDGSSIVEDKCFIFHFSIVGTASRACGAYIYK